MANQNVTKKKIKSVKPFFSFNETNEQRLLVIRSSPGQLVHYKKSIIPCPFFKRYCFQLSPRKTHSKFDPRVLGHVYDDYCDYERLTDTMVVSKRLGSGAGVNHAFLQLDLEQKLKFNVVVVKHCGLVRLCRLVTVSR
jgi:hypothetical protein